jgi:hypothetical protein
MATTLPGGLPFSTSWTAAAASVRGKLRPITGAIWPVSMSSVISVRASAVTVAVNAFRVCPVNRLRIAALMMLPAGPSHRPSRNQIRVALSPIAATFPRRLAGRTDLPFPLVRHREPPM